MLALTLGVTAMWLRSRPRTVAGWAAVGLLAVLIVTSGAWLTHAAGRIEHRGPLMLLTVAHMLAAAVWVGGLVQLGALWRLGRHDATAAAAWPVLVRRFSTLAAAAVGVLVLSALPLTWAYAGSWQALVGTGYGSLVLTKAALFLAVLGVALVNRRAVRAGAGLETASTWRVPRLAEAETIILVMILFAAASLSAQPPAADQSPADTATVGEVVEVFRPKVPSLHMPSPEAMRQSRTAMAAGAPRTREAYLWSNFSHNVSGLILLGTSLFGLVGLASGARWYRHWPLGFVALAAFVSLGPPPTKASGRWAPRRSGTSAPRPCSTGWPRGSSSRSGSPSGGRGPACSGRPRCLTSCPCSAVREACCSSRTPTPPFRARRAFSCRSRTRRWARSPR